MKKVFILLLVFLLCTCLVSCTNVTQKLDIPSNIKIEDNILMWNSVDGASQYIIYVNNQEVASTSNTSYDLSNIIFNENTEYKITIKARGDGYLKTESDFSNEISYAPDVAIDHNQNDPTYVPNDVVDVDENEITTLLFNSGLGYGVNALTARKAVGEARLVSFFDEALLAMSDVGKYNIGSSRSKAISKENIEDEIVAINSKLVYGNSSSAALAGMFTAGFEEKFSIDMAITSKNHVNQFYFILNMYVVGENYQLKNYQQPNAYNTKLSAFALQDILSLRNGTLSPELFFNRYGTHLTMAVSYGGMTDVNYAMFSQETIDSIEIASTLEASLYGGFSWGDLSAEASTSLGNTLQEKYYKNTANTTTCLHIESIGKNPFTSSSFYDFANRYSDWIDQFNDESNYRIVDVADNGLVPIWYYFPEEYSDVAEMLATYFNEQATEKGVALANKIARPIVEDKGDTTHFDGGHGTEDSPYVLSTREHFINIMEYGASATYIVNNDINLGDWMPLGSYSRNNGDRNSIPSLSNPFKGHLNGNNHTITYTINISNTNQDSDYGWGLFGIAQNAIFENITINASIRGNSSTKASSTVAGALTGWASNCSFKNCTSKGTISQDHNGSHNYGCVRSGGLVGMGTGCSFYRCTNNCTVLAGGFYASSGGIIGGMKNCTFDSCTNNGSIKSNHGKWVFGGDNHGDLYGKI